MSVLVTLQREGEGRARERQREVVEFKTNQRQRIGVNRVSRYALAGATNRVREVSIKPSLYTCPHSPEKSSNQATSLWVDYGHVGALIKDINLTQ